MSDVGVIDFKNAFPVFPLPGVVLLPHTIQAMHIFEPRYLQMIADCMESMDEGELGCADPIAIATFENATDQDPDSPAVVRPAVCVGRIVQHQALQDGRQNILVQGVCRARIMALEDAGMSCPYRRGILEAVDVFSQGDLPGLIREQLQSLLQGPRLKRLIAVDSVLDWIGRDDIPTTALIELISFTMIHDEETRYALLEESDPSARADLVSNELLRLDRLVALGDLQGYRNWPKGLSWN